MVFTPPNVCLDENAHDDEINLDQDFLGMFEGGDMDQNNFDCAIMSVMIGNNVMKWACEREHEPMGRNLWTRTNIFGIF